MALTVAGSAPAPAGHQGRAERPLESRYSGQDALLRPEPRGSVVVVHAEEGAGAGAAAAGAGAGTQTHNIHASVHHPKDRESRLNPSVPNRGGKKISKRPERRRGEKRGSWRRRGGSHLHNRLTAMTCPSDLSALRRFTAKRNCALHVECHRCSLSVCSPHYLKTRNQTERNHFKDTA